MSVTLHAHHGRAWTLQAVTPPQPVFAAEQRPHASVPNTGPALLTHWLTPVLGGERLAGLRLPDGRLVEITERAIHPATNVTRLRRPA